MTKISASHISKAMKAFKVDKALKSERSGFQSRIGCLRFGHEVEGEDNGDKVNEDVVRGASYRTPMYLLHTQTGSIPHITEEVLHMTFPTPFSNGLSLQGTCQVPPPVQISVDSTIRFVKSVEAFKKGIGAFVGLPKVPVFLTVHDPLFPLRPCHNDKFGIALWSRHGRQTLTPQHFVDSLKTYKANFSQVISDYDVNPKTSGMKRLKKSLSRAEEYTTKVISDTSVGCDGENGRNKTGIFITLEATWFQMDEDLARKTVATLLQSQHQIDGVVLAGLTERFGSKADANPIKSTKSDTDSSGGVRKHLEPEKLDICSQLDLEIVNKMIEVLPASLPKYVAGAFTLPQILDLMSRGIDIFDSSVASRMADNAEVFLLDRVEDVLPDISKSVVAMNGLNQEALPGRGDGAGESHEDVGMTSSVVSLFNKRYFDDFRPISKTCTCYTCRKHTRSYVHHLFATDELLGPVLVQIHNLTSLDRFFHIIRSIIETSESPESLEQRFKSIKEALGSTEPTDDNDENEKLAEKL